MRNLNILNHSILQCGGECKILLEISVSAKVSEIVSSKNISKCKEAGTSLLKAVKEMGRGREG